MSLVSNVQHNLGCDTRPLIFGRPATTSEVHEVEQKLGFPLPPSSAPPGDLADTRDGTGQDEPPNHDFTVFDRLLPHPLYKGWVCIVNPTKETFVAKVQPLLEEGYALAVRKHTKRGERTG